MKLINIKTLPQYLYSNSCNVNIAKYKIVQVFVGVEVDLIRFQIKQIANENY